MRSRAIIRGLVFAALMVAASGGRAAAQVGSGNVEAALDLANDTAKVLKLSDLCFAYRRINGDSALMFGQAALELSRKLHYARGEAQACNDIAIILIDRSAFAEADSLLHVALRIRTELGDMSGVGAIHNKLGNIFQSQSRFEEALAENLEALSIFERTGPPAKEATILNNIAILQLNLHRATAALATHERAANIRRSLGDGQGLAESNGNMANVRLYLGDTTAAIGLYEQAIGYFRAHHLQRELAIQLHNLGGVYLAQHQPGRASDLYEEALHIREGIGEKKAIASSLIGLGSTYMQRGQMLEAKHLLKEALHTSTEAGARGEEMQALLNLARVYAHANNGDSMLWFQERYSALKDSVFTEDLNARTIEMEARYETEKKERQLQRQRADLTAKNLRIAELGKRAERRRFWLAVSLGTIALIIISTVLLLQIQRRRARASRDAALIAERERGLKAVLESTEGERRRLAGELHDGVGQQLTGLRYRLEDVLGRVNQQMPQEQQRAGEVMSLLDDASRDVRGIAHSLRPRALDDLGLAPALGDMLQKALGKPGIQVNYEHFGLEARLPQQVEVGVYRIAQELVNNIIKHAEARLVNVQLLRNKGNLVLIVEDDGKGMNGQDGNGIGILSMHDRARALHGQIEFERAPENGTVVTLRVPLTNGNSA